MPETAPPSTLTGLLRQRNEALATLEREIDDLPPEEQLARRDDLRAAHAAVREVEEQVTERAAWDSERLQFREQPATQADLERVEGLAHGGGGGNLTFERAAEFNDAGAGDVYNPLNADYFNPAATFHQFAREMNAPLVNTEGRLIAIPGMMERAMGLTPQQTEIARDMELRRDYPLTTTAGGGFATSVPWIGLWTLGEHPARILDIIPRLGIDRLFFWGTVQTTRTSNADEFGQTTGPDLSGTGDGVSQFAFNRGDSAQRPIALVHIITGTNVAAAALESEPMLNDLLLGQTRAAIIQRMGALAISGNTDNSFRGFLNQDPVLTGENWEGDTDVAPQNLMDATVDARTSIGTSGVFADENSIEVAVHPVLHDRILKARDGDNRYLFQQPISPRGANYYGMRWTRDAQFPADADAANSGLIGDFTNGCRMVTFGDVMIDTSNSNRNNFEVGLVSLRAHVWAYLYVPIGSAFRMLHRDDTP